MPFRKDLPVRVRGVAHAFLILFFALRTFPKFNILTLRLPFDHFTLFWLYLDDFRQFRRDL